MFSSRGVHVVFRFMRRNVLFYVCLFSLASYATFSGAALQDHGSYPHDTVIGNPVASQAEVDFLAAEVAAEELMRTSGLLVIVLCSPFRSPCDEPKPIFRDLEREYRSYADFVMIDVTKALQYYFLLFGINVLPTMYIVSRGQVLEEILGPRTKGYLADRIVSWSKKIAGGHCQQGQTPPDQLCETGDASLTIGDFDYARDGQAALALLDKDRFWLIPPGYDEYHALETKSPNKNPLYRGKMAIKVLHDQGVFAGFVSYYMRDANKGTILLLVIDEKFRNKGYGKRLIRCALGALKNMGAQQVEIATADMNFPAQRVYESIGFTELHLLDRYVHYRYTFQH
jgi:ribosomal protein S18 acetylase RimI-like enzyme